MRPFFGLMQKDLRLIYRDPQTTILLIIVPFIHASLLSVAFEQLAVGKPNIDVRVLDQDQTEASSRVVEGLQTSDVVGIEVESGSERPGDLLDANHFAVLVIPEGFGEALQQQGRASIVTYGDPARVAFVEVLREQLQGTLAMAQLPRAASSSVGDPDGSVQLALDEAVASAVGAVSLETIPASEKGVFPSAFEQTVPGFAVMFGFFIAVLVAVVLIRETDRYKTWQRTVVAPISRSSMFAARMLVYAFIGVLQLAAMLILGRIVWGMELGSAPFSLGLIAAASAIVAVTFGLLVSLIFARNLAAAIAILNVLVILMGAVGGALVPVAFLPDWIATMSPVMPQYWAIEGIQDVIARGEGFTTILPTVGVLIAFSAVFLLVSLRLRPVEAFR